MHPPFSHASTLPLCHTHNHSPMARIKLSILDSTLTEVPTPPCAPQGIAMTPNPNWVPDFNQPNPQMNDVAYIVLDKPVTNILPAQLAPANLVGGLLAIRGGELVVCTMVAELDKPVTNILPVQHAPANLVGGLLAHRGWRAGGTCDCCMVTCWHPAGSWAGSWKTAGPRLTPAPQLVSAHSAACSVKRGGGLSNTHELPWLSVPNTVDSDVCRASRSSPRPSRLAGESPPPTEPGSPTN